MISRRLSVLALTAGLLAMAPAAATAQEQAPVAAEAETLDPAALAALDRMGAALRELGRFSVVSEGTLESVYANGQKLHAPVRTTYLVEMPGRMTVDVETAKSHTRLIYDGTAMTVVGLKARKYVRFPLTGTVAEVFERIEDDFGISLPLREMFLWGSELNDAETPRAAVLVGESMVGGVKTDHYAFRQATIDWQVWLDQGDKPLPRKMVVTRTDVAEQPQFIALFTWDTAPKLASDAFAWTPEADYELVDFGTAKLVDDAAIKAKR